MVELIFPVEQSHVSLPCPALPFRHDGQDKARTRVGHLKSCRQAARDTKSNKGGAATTHHYVHTQTSPPQPLFIALAHLPPSGETRLTTPAMHSLQKGHDCGYGGTSGPRLISTVLPGPQRDADFSPRKVTLRIPAWDNLSCQDSSVSSPFPSCSVGMTGA